MMITIMILSNPIKNITKSHNHLLRSPVRPAGAFLYEDMTLTLAS